MKQEKIYIAGPMCFYQNGTEVWNLLKEKTKARGYGVTMPTEKEVEMDPVDLQKNARGIFQNCSQAMEETTAILCNLEFFRSSNPDGGSMFELGMAYAKGIPCYGYTKDARPMVWKYQGAVIKDGEICDQEGRPLPYGDLPFSPNISGACKIVEGDYEDCLDVFTLDLLEKRKREGLGQKPEAQTIEEKEEERGKSDRKKPVIYLAGPERYDRDAKVFYEKMKQECEAMGFFAITPADEVPGIPVSDTEDPVAKGYRTFLRQQHQVRNCDLILANLNDFHGWEPESDTAFECGMAYGLGKKTFGFMADTTRMIDRVPNLGEASGYRDGCGCNVENFDFPLNLMFSGSMPICQAKDYLDALRQIPGEFFRN